MPLGKSFLLKGRGIMIISASRRSDIPTYYSEWLINRLREEFVFVRNPMNIHQVSKINLSPDVVDGLILWTKHPIPMLGSLSELEKYNYYFQFTLNAYGKDVEPNIPSKKEVIIPAFMRLSKTIGRERVIWRYDPIFFSEKYTMDYHCKYFKRLVSILSDYTEKCTISFLDLYRNTTRNIRPLQVQIETHDQQLELLDRFSTTALQYGIYIDTCAEAIDLNGLEIPHACCIDKERLERLGHCKLKVEKDKNQRQECGCVSSIDIGAYNTCKNGCLYCYANYSTTTVLKNSENHNPTSPLLFGAVGKDDKIVERKMVSWKTESSEVHQESIFDLPIDG